MVKSYVKSASYYFIWGEKSYEQPQTVMVACKLV